MSIINIFIKPSFFFVFAPIFPLMVYIRYGLSKQLLQVLTFIFIACLFCMIQYYWLYHEFVTNIIIYQGKESSIALRPFLEWSGISKNISLNLFQSPAFPFLFIIFYCKSIYKNIIIWYSLLLFISSILIFIFIAEIGPRSGHGNFVWQANISMYILFIVCFWDFFYNFKIQTFCS